MIAPQFYVEVFRPNKFGMTTEFGSSEDFRFDDPILWELKNCEILQELDCLTIAGDATPKTMENLWQLTGRASDDNWITRYPDYTKPVFSYQFCDAAIYDGTEDPEDFVGIIVSDGWNDASGNFSINMRRMNPPRGQLIPVQTMVTVPDLRFDDLTNTYVPGFLTLVLPVGEYTGVMGYKFTNPFLHHIDLSEVSGVYDVFTEGIILAEIPIQQLEAGSRERWTFENITDSDYFDGSHILIRSEKIESKKNKGERAEAGYHHFYDERITVANKDMWDALGFTYTVYDPEYKISHQGCICTVNLSKIDYTTTNVGTAAYRNGRYWRGPEHNRDVSNYLDPASRWRDVSSLITGATVTVDDATGWEDDIKPVVTITNNSTKSDSRPVCWFITETNVAIIGNANAGSWFTSENLLTTNGLSYTWGEDFKNSSGTVSWMPVSLAGNELPAPVDGGYVEIRAGWDDAAPVAYQQPADPNIVGWTHPASNPTRRSGDVDKIGGLEMTLDFGSYDTAKLASKKSQMIDIRQAGGQTVYEWISMIANRLGIPSSRVYCQADLQNQMIPPNEIPSKPGLDPQDGYDFLSHIGDVERNMDIRICWDRNKDYTIWVDSGKPVWAYDAADIKLTLNEDDANFYSGILEIDGTFDTENYKNFLKFKIGRHGKTESGYLYDPLASRSLIDQDDFQVFIQDADSDTVQKVIKRYMKENRYEGLNLGLKIRVQIAMRPDLRPDDFILLSKCDGLSNSQVPGIFQILTHTLTIDSETLEGYSEITAAYVNLSEEEVMKSFNESFFN